MTIKRQFIASNVRDIRASTLKLLKHRPVY